MREVGTEKTWNWSSKREHTLAEKENEKGELKMKKSLKLY